MKTILALVAAAAIGAASPAAAPPHPAPPQPPPGHTIDDNNVNSGGTNAVWRSRNDGTGGRGSGTGGAGGVGPLMEYHTTPACPGNSAESSSSELCETATTACRDATSGPGYLTYVYARPRVEKPAIAKPWEWIGSTCYPDEAIAAERHRITLADIQQEFAQTPFASPVAAIQPPGGETLVTLPIYYSTSWTTAGYGPEQTRRLTLLGRTLDLRVALVSYTYDHGDGVVTGPTTSTGGPYPNGDVTHAYTRPGVYTPRITAILTAAYRLDGGPWAPIEGTATRTSTLPPVTVHTATNRLRAD